MRDASSFDATFEVDELFDDNYSYFYEAVNPPALSDKEAAVIGRLLRLDPGSQVIDLGCGDGRLSGRLAAAGLRVLGIDSNEGFIERAREAHRSAEGDLEFALSDMRDLPDSPPADGVFLWSNTFGYFSDEENFALLETVRRRLRPGGVLLIEQHHRDWILANWQSALVTRRGSEDIMLDENEFDPVAGRTINHRTYIRDGRVVGKARFFSRLLAESEFAFWLQRAGFEQIEFFGGDGEPLRPSDPRLVVRAVRPLT